MSCQTSTSSPLSTIKSWQNKAKNIDELLGIRLSWQKPFDKRTRVVVGLALNHDLEALEKACTFNPVRPTSITFGAACDVQIGIQKPV